MPLLCRLAACRHGSTAVELALILPAFLAVVFGAIELSRYVWTRTTVQHATDEAARYALAHPTATSAAIVQVAKDAAIGLDANDPCLLGLRRRYPIRSMGVFGSYARGEQREDSDVDVLVELGDDLDLIAYAGLQIELSDALGVPVDLVEREALRPRLAAQVLAEVVPL
ncbi:MAG: pilus assembly protein [Alphaproteobacteria bacterium]|nr:pilus assembly protein [Alphaproteobacteria bacterium]